MTDFEVSVFVVDDDASVRKATARLFRSSGFKVLTFESADEFLEFPAPKGPCCVVLDLKMPGLSGRALQEELAARKLNLPIVFLTGHGDIPTTVAAMKQGAVDFLPKPVDDQRLLDVVHKAVTKHALDLEQSTDVRAFRDGLETLTKREYEVMLLVIQGLLNKQIAAQLGVTEATVKVHRGRVMEKAGVESLAELVRLCERAQIAD